MDWRIQRQIIIFSIYFLIVALPVALTVFLLLRKTSSCFDGLQNGAEEGVDCNGSCELRCDGTYRDVRVNFSRGLKVDEGVYDIFALLENYNENVSFPNVPYNISFYSSEGKLLGTASGSLALLPQTKSAIYLPNLKIAQEPKTIDLSLLPHKGMGFYDLESIPKNISVESWQAQRGANNSLQVVGEIKNPNNQEVKNLEVYAMLYDDTRTVYAVSKTKVYSVKGREKTAVAFTWGDILTPTNVEFLVVINQDERL
jgi:hypothetical protein